ncbi:peptidase, partial [Lysobacter sp. 2RAB21]
MTFNKPQVLLLSLAIAAAVAACGKQETSTPAAGGDATAAKPAEAVQFKLDESKLPPVNRFLMSDLDTTKDACTDFGGYVNGKWLAANAIPGDRTSWG